MKKFCLILVAMATSILIENAHEKRIECASAQEAIARGIKELLEDQEFGAKLGSFLGEVGNKIGQRAQRCLKNKLLLDTIVQKIKRYAVLYQPPENRDLLHEYAKEENAINKNLYKALEATPAKKKYLYHEHQKALQALHKKPKFKAIKELADLHDELTALGLEIIMLVQNLFVGQEEFMDFMHNWVASVQKEFATTIKV